MLVGRFGVVLDANVLYSATLRGALLRMAQERLFRPMWSELILDEWERNVRANNPHLVDDQFSRMHAIFRLFPDAYVAGQQHLRLADPLLTLTTSMCSRRRSRGPRTRSSPSTRRTSRRRWLMTWAWRSGIPTSSW